MVFKIYRYWYTDLLIEVEFDSVSEHRLDDPDKFAGAVPRGIVMRPAFRILFVIISFEGLRVYRYPVNNLNKLYKEWENAGRFILGFFFAQWARRRSDDDGFYVIGTSCGVPVQKGYGLHSVLDVCHNRL